MTDLTLTCTRTMNASPERVYNAWLDPVMMAKFMSPGPDMHVTEARADARVGGRFLVVMMADKPLPHTGTYKVLTPHSRIVFTWESAWSAPQSEVELRLSPVADGTKVVLTHVKFASEESRDNHKRGWGAILGKLATALEGR